MGCQAGREALPCSLAQGVKPGAMLPESPIVDKPQEREEGADALRGA